MAIDTDHKKGSLIGLMLPPNATIEQNDWQTLLGLYSGISVTLAGGRVGIITVSSVARQTATAAATANDTVTAGGALG